LAVSDPAILQSAANYFSDCAIEIAIPSVCL